MAIYNQTPSRDKALLKLKHYCAYQERCHQEVREKLYSLGLRSNQVEEIIAALIEENYLNEERFAVQYAGGKFRMKQWGRVKIKYALKQKQVSDYCIEKALLQIDEAAYLQTLEKLADDKQKTIAGETHPLIKLKKTTDYLFMKGYESNLVREVLRNLYQ